mmetsp:Transcript_1814/g.2332  ORF Transcript_1814/g.2332 Transcript_1814/m.2332 type:complete len:217 (+) Transcript_1814:145-795(+)|eukprot:CAMPEP_0204827418 /NCGR_PEP_ID=MMETSP1346-20131115/4879_1 /ASSEMBLY_ACC=CAM_ASM_000771 /TAXON_ID=215587 /ORGANISM="Aplanochytrium stocchinoi, Strain GSBS06" /LENGTH=216 /DNA_ID=CAMNT_0051955835 /DNA_START=162 /DNA_END=812 /DNA_ORIENTATION=+
MSILKACSIVPEILIDAPEEIHDQSTIKRFKDAKAVVFLRTMRLGCIVTVRGGKGVLLKKMSDDSWSAPVALMFGGPALGASIGIEIADMVIFINTDEALKGFMESSAGVGLSAGMALGPIGRYGEGMISTAVKNGTIIYAASKGLYGGVNVEFSGIMIDKTANQSQYGFENSNPEEILKAPKPTGEVFDKMYKSIDAVMKSSKQAAEGTAPSANE